MPNRRCSFRNRNRSQANRLPHVRHEPDEDISLVRIKMADIAVEPAFAGPTEAQRLFPWLEMAEFCQADDHIARIDDREVSAFLDLRDATADHSAHYGK